jgi:hypothetical protein
MVGAWVLAAIVAGYATMCPAALGTAAVPLDRRDVVVRLVTEFLAGDNEVRAPLSLSLFILFSFHHGRGQMRTTDMYDREVDQASAGPAVS